MFGRSKKSNESNQNASSSRNDSNRNDSNRNESSRNERSSNRNSNSNKVLPVRTEIPVQTGILPTRTTRTEATLSHQTLVLNQVTRAIQAEALQTNPAETKAG